MNTSPPIYPPLSAYLAVHDAARAIEFYKAAFGATELFRLNDPESGKIGHAELMINGALIMLSDEYPAIHKSPQTLSGTSVRFCLMVENADAAVDRAVTAGATVVRPPGDQFYGFRCASVRDPFGHEWLLQHQIEKVSPAEMQRRWDAMAKKC
ncbi:MAG: VOC family protein [Verrucomicrobia bacterium]|nr:VOC family protein [Verrucomicrobiota bacterium]